MDDYLSLTYDQLAARLGVQKDSLRRLVRRNNWRRSQTNDGSVRIDVPLDYLREREVSTLPPDIDEPAEAEAAAPNPLKEIVARLERQLSDMRDLMLSERGRADANGKRADAEAARAGALEGAVACEARRADAEMSRADAHALRAVSEAERAAGSEGREIVARLRAEMIEAERDTWQELATRPRGILWFWRRDRKLAAAVEAMQQDKAAA